MNLTQSLSLRSISNLSSALFNINQRMKMLRIKMIYL